jgi:hypothetical protein
VQASFEQTRKRRIGERCRVVHRRSIIGGRARRKART